MKKIDFGQSITILANLGVIAGIVFLGVELNQNQQTLEQQLSLDLLTGRDAAVERFNGFRSQLLENPYLIPVWNKGRSDEPLTDEELEQFELLCANYIWNQTALYARFTTLALPEEIAATVRVLSGQRDNSERFGQCWDQSKTGIRERGYGELVDLVDAQ